MPEETYAAMVRLMMERAGVSERRAVGLVNRVLGPAMLAPPMSDVVRRSTDCGHVYWSFEGMWLPCHESGSHREHTDEAMSETWHDGQPRDVSAQEWES